MPDKPGGHISDNDGVCWTKVEEKKARNNRENGFDSFYAHWSVNSTTVYIVMYYCTITFYAIKMEKSSNTFSLHNQIFQAHVENMA